MDEPKTKQKKLTKQNSQDIVKPFSPNPIRMTLLTFYRHSHMTKALHILLSWGAGELIYPQGKAMKASPACLMSNQTDSHHPHTDMEGEEDIRQINSPIQRTSICDDQLPSRQDSWQDSCSQGCHLGKFMTVVQQALLLMLLLFTTARLTNGRKSLWGPQPQHHSSL